MAITTEQKYLLNNKAGSIARKVALGTLIETAETSAPAALSVTAAVLAADAVTTSKILDANVTEAKLAAQAVGLNAGRVCIGLFDPSAVAGDRTIAAHTLSSTALPAKAIITRLSYDVLTTFTSATDAATVALSVEGANDLKSAVAISDVSNPWDAGIHAGIPVATAATYVKTTVARSIVVTVAVEALTAGKMYVYADYIQGF